MSMTSEVASSMKPVFPVSNSMAVFLRRETVLAS